MLRLCNGKATLLVSLSGILALGCGGGGGGDNGGTPPTTTAIAKASSNSGDAQTAAVGQPLPAPLQVVVTEGGAPSAGATVSWATTTGGSLNPTSAATDANGIASTAWTLGTTSGAQTATAALSGASGSPVTFTATASPGAAAALTDAGGNNQSGEINASLATPLQAKVEDEFGNGVPGVAVAWAATGATVSAASVPSDNTGISSVNVTLGGTAGPVSITATAEGLTGSPLTFNATATPPTPIPTAITVQVRNNFFSPSNDTVAVGGTVTWSWNAAGAVHNVTSTGSPTFANSGDKTSGTYEATFSTAGSYNYICTIHPDQMQGRVVVR